MEKLHAKIVHAGIHMAALIFSLAGIVLAIQLKNTYGLEHFTTLHGIFGLLTFITFTAQVTFPLDNSNYNNVLTTLRDRLKTFDTTKDWDAATCEEAN